MSHRLPAGDIADVLRECLRVTLASCEKRRKGAARPAPISPAAPVACEQSAATSSRYVPTAVRAAIWARDGGRCTFVAPDGRRCDSTYQLEPHHVVAFARGGPGTVDNVTVRCRVHKQHAAEVDFGRAHLDRRRRQLALL